MDTLEFKNHQQNVSKSEDMACAAMKDDADFVDKLDDYLWNLLNYVLRESNFRSVCFANLKIDR